MDCSAQKSGELQKIIFPKLEDVPPDSRPIPISFPMHQIFMEHNNNIKTEPGLVSGVGVGVGVVGGGGVGGGVGGGEQQCSGCGSRISDRFLLQVSGGTWHGKCLRCSSCHVPLESEPLCYLRNSQVFCRTDYQRLFGRKCSKCLRTISATDWVRRAREQVYHLACFACDACKRQLSTGEEFALSEDKVLCKIHFQEIFDNGASSNEDSCDGESTCSSSKSKTKRVRTTFTDEQLQILQANFQIDSNPDGQDLERIAQITGLSKRVTQVWFQNSRARHKKHMAKQKKNYHPGRYVSG